MDTARAVLSSWSEDDGGGFQARCASSSKNRQPRMALNEARAQAEVLGHRSSSTSTVQACTPVGSKIRRFWYGPASTVIALRYPSNLLRFDHVRTKPTSTSHYLLTWTMHC